MGGVGGISFCGQKKTSVRIAWLRLIAKSLWSTSELLKWLSSALRP